METKNKELLPIRYEDRITGKGSYFAMWLGIAVIIATFSLGGEGVQQIKLGWVALACFLANVLVGFIMTLTGDVGVEHGITFPVYMRAPFGMKGAALPILCRAVLGCIWFGIQSYYGATAMNYIINYLTGFNNWYVCFLIFTAAQVINTAMGLKAIERFANFAAPCIAIISIWMFYRLSIQAQGAGIDIWNTVLAPGQGSINTATVSLHVFFLVFCTNISYWSTTTADSQTLARTTKAPKNEKNWFARNAIAMCGHMLALPITQTFCIVIGGVAMLVAGNWNPIEALQQTASGGALLVLLLLIILAQWSTNISANMMLPAVSFHNTFPKLLTYRKAVILVGLISVLSFPWEIMARIGGFLNAMSAIYAPIAGISVVDYYLFRKRRLNVPELYKEKGQFYGEGGWNLSGVISMAAGFAASLLIAKYAYLVGFFTGGIVYYILNKVWWMKVHKQAEIEENFDEKYLGLSVGHEWEIS